MTTTNDEGDLFDTDVISDVADGHGVDDEELATTLARHQRSVEALPGVENLAYEWRKQYESPLVERTTTAYYFAVPERVWEEFGNALDARDSITAALREVHRVTVAERTDVEPRPSGAVAYVVLDRNVNDSQPGKS